MLDNDVNQHADFLSIILDLNPLKWARSAEKDASGDSLSLEKAIECLLLFCNAHLSLRTENDLVVYGAAAGKSDVLFSSLDPHEAEEEEAAEASGMAYQQFRLVDDRITRRVRRLLSDDVLAIDRPPNLVGAMTRSLCHFNRVARDEEHRPVQPRILILNVSADSSSQYIPMMNCIFSAQKSSIPIDVCKIFGDDAVFLQQASFLTSGLYYRIERRAGLLQYLMMSFLPGRAARKHLSLPHQDQVDLRAACFCHRRIVDIGFVCSVCLSIFCSPVPQCTTCKTSFPLASLKRLANTRGSLKR